MEVASNPFPIPNPIPNNPEPTDQRPPIRPGVGLGRTAGVMFGSLGDRMALGRRFWVSLSSVKVPLYVHIQGVWTVVEVDGKVWMTTGGTRHSICTAYRMGSAQHDPKW